MNTALSITSPQTIQSLLQEAFDLRSRFIISLAREKGSQFDIAGLLREIDDKALTMEIIGLSATPAAWMGQTVTCYFKIRDHGRKADIFYNFSSQVLEALAARNNSRLLLQRPIALDIGQRRSSIRLGPGLDDILNFSLWEEGNMVFRCPKSDRVKLRPPLVGGQMFDHGLVTIKDISAGGIRLRLAAKLLKDISAKILAQAAIPAEKNKPVGPAAWNRGTRLVVWFALNDQPTTGHLVFWLKGRISYRREDILNKDLEFGLELTHHGKNDPNGKISWNPVQDNDVQELGAWVYQRYLERFRRGIA